MNTQTCENSIVVLKKVRDECKSQLDDGVLSDLDRVIAELEKQRNGGMSALEASVLSVRVLRFIADLVRLVTSFDDWLK
ncbi:MAG: hypothetical protein EOO38_03495 [Cytophagaceae bacterium]|nr:MAG: hypothetical protein EOO38_03495 [Cytophagaceae bacterium]